MTEFLHIGGRLLLPGVACALDLSGDSKIESSVGPTAITVNCGSIQFKATKRGSDSAGP